MLFPVTVIASEINRVLTTSLCVPISLLEVKELRGLELVIASYARLPCDNFIDLMSPMTTSVELVNTQRVTGEFWPSAEGESLHSLVDASHSQAETL